MLGHAWVMHCMYGMGKNALLFLGVFDAQA